MALFVAGAGLGRGVFTDGPIASGALIERAPVIALPREQIDDLSRTSLYDYWFAWGEDDQAAALAVGFGSIYNHARAPNAAYTKNFGAAHLEFRALRSIPSGEEIRIDYTGGGDPSAPLWFTPAGEDTPGPLPCDPIARRADVVVAEVAGKGRGVFAERAFAMGEAIETAPVIVLPGEEWPRVERTVLDHYCFAWGDALQHAAFTLGCGSLYNHADQAAARFTRNLEARTISFIANRPVAAGSEITIDYRSSYAEWFPLWFDVR